MKAALLFVVTALMLCLPLRVHAQEGTPTPPPSSAIAGQVVKTACASAFDYDRLSDLQAVVLAEAKRQAVNELSGELITSFTEVENFVVTRDQIRTLSSGFVRIGETNYANGSQLGDVCVTLTGYITIEDLALFEPVRLSKRYCLSDPDLTVSQIRTRVQEEAWLQALIEYDHKLNGQDRDILLRLLQRAEYTQMGFISSTDTYCATVHGDLIPIEVVTLQTVVGVENTNASQAVTTTVETEQLTTGYGSNYQPSFSPDGNYVTFISTRDGNPEIYIMSADGANQTRLTFTPTLSEDVPSFTPDGSGILFGTYDGHDEEIYIMNRDGSEVHNVSSSPNSDEGRPRAMPLGFGYRVLFDSNRTGNWEIFSASLSGKTLGPAVQVTARPEFADRLPSYVSLGRKIVFRSERNGESRIYMMDTNGGNVTLFSILPTAANDYYPTTSRDGTWIAFTSDREGNRDIYVTSLGSQEIQNLTQNEANDDTPAISPDNRWLAFSSDREAGSYHLYRIPLPIAADQ